jgi:rhodanese-related sulfurtransferase/DNA-binding transcriptional ArsR family regulator
MDKALKEYKDLLYRQFAIVGKAVSSHKRLEVLDLLSQGERTVEELAKETDSSISSVSQHLQILKTARLVENRKQGLYVFYRLADEAVGEFWRTLRSLAVARLAELREAIRVNLEDKDELEQVSHEDLLERARRRDVVVLDVRPEVEFKAGHIPEALSIPLDELERRLSELPSDREVVAYCRGPYCLMALEAVGLLRSRGYRARRLEDGFPEWRAEGLPTERADNSEPDTRTQK